MIYTLIAYRPSGADYSCGRVDEYFDSDMQVHEFESREAIAIKISEFLMENKKKKRGEGEYEFQILINGTVGIFMEDFKDLSDLENTQTYIKNQANVYFDRMVKQENKIKEREEAQKKKDEEIRKKKVEEEKERKDKAEYERLKAKYEKSSSF